MKVREGCGLQSQLQLSCAHSFTPTESSQIAYRCGIPRSRTARDLAPAFVTLCVRTRLQSCRRCTPGISEPALAGDTTYRWRVPWISRCSRPGRTTWKCAKVVVFNSSFSLPALIRLLQQQAARSHIDDGIPGSRTARDPGHPPWSVASLARLKCRRSRRGVGNYNPVPRCGTTQLSQGRSATGAPDSRLFCANWGG